MPSRCQFRILSNPLQESLAKIAVIFVAIFTLVLMLGAMMYVGTRRTNGFESTPVSIYWPITTVGYGDIMPGTTLGKLIASLILMLGYVIIAVPTGIVAISLWVLQTACRSCPGAPKLWTPGHDLHAVHCECASVSYRSVAIEGGAYVSPSNERTCLSS
ncbi:potassium channel family protein [Spirosoma fluminis]